MMWRSVPSVSKPGRGRRRAACPRASSHSDDGPGRMRMAWFGPDRIPVLDALDVVPHAVGVDHVPPAASVIAEHAAVDVIAARRRSSASGAGPSRCRPVLAHQLVVAADAARGDDDRLRPELEGADDRRANSCWPRSTLLGVKHFAAHAVDRGAGSREFIDAMPEFEGDQPALRTLAHARDRRARSRPALCPR